jgi:hypothetical protein
MLAQQLGLIFHRGVGFHVLRKFGDGPHAKIADGFGPPMACYRLRAPAGGAAEGFHAVEGADGGRFRWSGSDTLHWQIDVPAPRRAVQIMVPYLHESRLGFAAACRVDIAGRAVNSASVRESSIMAEADGVAPGLIQVILRTPALRLPPNDSRQLGIAIELAESVEPGQTNDQSP